MFIVLAVLAIVAVGSCMQRVSGMGLGLIAGPVLTVMLGPVEGIMVVNILAMVNAAATTVTVKADVDWQKWRLICSVLIFGSLPAAWLVATTPTAPLLIIVGGALLVALGVVTFGKKYVPTPRGTWPALLAGVIGGFTNTLAGIAGPVITVYAQAAGWPQRVYAATLQPIFMVAGAISFAMKIATGAGDMSQVDWLIWPAAIVGMAIGITSGVRLARRVDREVARKLSLSVAAAGAAYAVFRGVVML